MRVAELWGKAALGNNEGEEPEDKFRKLLVSVGHRRLVSKKKQPSLEE